MSAIIATMNDADWQRAVSYIQDQRRARGEAEEAYPCEAEVLLRQIKLHAELDVGILAMLSGV